MPRYGDVGEQYFADGKPNAGGSIAFTLTSTGNNTITYADEAMTTPNTNPVILDASGRQPAIWHSEAIGLLTVTVT